MNRLIRCFLAFLLVCGMAADVETINAQSASKGRLYGVVSQTATGQPVEAANVYLQGTKLGAITDADGYFNMKAVPPGVYQIVVSKVGFAPRQMEVSVFPNQDQRLEFQLDEQVIMMEGLIIESEAPAEEQQDKLLQERQQAVEIQDAIGAEEMSRTGSGDAAEAVGKVTGASVVDGKYVYVRGLGDRYSSTQLNGSELPSADPYRKAVHMDLFPSSLLDRIVTIKTFSPDKPGNFSGGSVEMWTKSFPEEFTFSFSQSYSYNSQSSFNSNAILYPGGGHDWLGMDDGTRDIPAALKDPNLVIPRLTLAQRDDALAAELDRLSKAFNPVMYPTTGTLPSNQSYSVTVGDQLDLGGKPLGLLGSFSYSRKANFYDNGTAGRYNLTGNVATTDDLNNDFLLSDEKGSDEVLWGGLLNASFKATENHELGFNLIYNQSGESSARYLVGTFPRDLPDYARYETRALKYTERTLNSFQFRGEHDLPKLLSAHVEWTGSINDSKLYEPDLRYFSNSMYLDPDNPDGPSADTSFGISQSIYPMPNRYYRDLNENNANMDLKIGVPFKQWSGLHSRFKFGGKYVTTDRDFTERRFQFEPGSSSFNYHAFQGDPVAYWSDANTGLVDTTGRFNLFGNYVKNATEPRGSYDGTQDITAAFAMVELPITPELQFIGGVRMEDTDLKVASRDETLPTGEIDVTDYLPSANLIYLYRDDMNFRASYGRTLARPNFREMAPYASFDFVNDYTFIGNVNLKRTLIDNYDFRWEWFVRNGEVIAASVFYKSFTNPIERVIKNINAEVQYQNVDKADLLGVEFEVRQRLDKIHTALDPFSVGVNLSLVNSNVDIAEEELEVIRAVDPNAEASREMQGQSSYVLNMDVSYDNFEWGTTASVLFNVFGARLSEVSLGGTPDVYEQPRPKLDFTLKQNLWQGIGLKFTAKNLLNSDYEKVHSYKGKDYIYHSYTIGRTFSLGLNYTFSN